MRLRIGVFSALLVSAFLWSWVRGVEAQKLTKIQAAHPIENLGWYPVYVAMKKGIYAKYGLELQMITMRSRLAVTALTTGQIDYISTMGTPMNAISRGVPAKVVMVLDHKPFFVLSAQDYVKTAKDLRGRTIAINQVGGSLDLSLVWILESFGIKRSEVQVLPTGTGYNAFIALQSKRVDAAMLSSPMDFTLEKQGGFNRIANLDELLDAPLGGWVATEDYIRKNRDQVKQLIKGSLEGIAYTKAHREEAIPLLNDFLSLRDMKVAERAYDKYRGIFPDDGMASKEALRRTAQLSRIPDDKPIDHIFDWSILEEARAELKK